jgi:hypothetical protein
VIAWQAPPPEPVTGELTRLETGLARWLAEQPGVYGLVAVCPTRMGAESVYRRVIRGTWPWSGGADRWHCRIRQDQTPVGDTQWRVYVARGAVELPQ